MTHTWGFPGGASGKELACNAGKHMRHGFDPWVGKIPWRRAWQSTLASLPVLQTGREVWTGESGGEGGRVWKVGRHGEQQVLRP